MSIIPIDMHRPSPLKSPHLTCMDAMEVKKTLSNSIACSIFLLFLVCISCTSFVQNALGPSFGKN